MLRRNATVLLIALGVSIASLAQSPIGTTPVTVTAVPVIKSSLLSPTFRNLLSFMGDRLAVAGNERLTLNGTVTLADGSKTIAIVTLELPDHLRYVQTLPPRTVVYDGSTIQTSTGPPTTADNNLVESLVLDGVERFLISQTEGLAFRFMGPHVKLVDPTNSSRSTSLCELYQVSERERFNGSLKRKQKLFCFDSRTRLIASVFYQDPGIGSQVETRWSAWRQSGSNQVPGTIARYENGKTVFSLAVASSAVAPVSNDGSFGKP